MGQPLVFGRLGRFARACLVLALVPHQPQRLERLCARPELLPAGRAVVLQTAVIDSLGSVICKIFPYRAREKKDNAAQQPLRRKLLQGRQDMQMV